MKGSVLVVDDEEVILKSCERILEPEGYDVNTALSALKALELLGGAKPYDLVITDIKMPGMDGIEFIKKLRAGNPDICIVLITGHPSQESIKEALALGIVDYLPKPFSPSLLAETAEKAMEVRKKSVKPDIQNVTGETVAKLTGIIQKYKDKPGSLIPVLQEAQELVGYLPPVVQRHIARGLNVPVSEVHGVVSFYSFFTMKPKGKHNVRVCLGTACYVKRAEEILARLKDRLKIDIGEVTPDKKFSLESVRCLGACGLAPVVVVDKDTHGSVNPVKTLDILAQYENE
ncbi:MAG: NAD(P)H-dependent oxidoreductase subunit E [Nitrospiraceae bacterium]|nr:NAD(P)H-dependent oxidoreductase subunit E [Nitrospiraceae bacterium]